MPPRTGYRGVETAMGSQLLKVTLCRSLSGASGLAGGVAGVAKYPKANLLCLSFLHLSKFPIAELSPLRWAKAQSFCSEADKEKDTLITPRRGRRSG